jgi:hypothetical protein
MEESESKKTLPFKIQGSRHDGKAIGGLLQKLFAPIGKPRLLLPQLCEVVPVQTDKRREDGDRGAAG